MAQDKQETREEEVARVRSYLASQAMRRTVGQLVEALQEAHHQFLAVTATVPDAAFRTVPGEGEWSAADVLAHIHTMAAIDERSICGVIERGEQPAQVNDALSPAPAHATREHMLADIEGFRQRLIAVVLRTDPQAHLDIVWGHREFGMMNWREWLLFARVHTLDHARQMQAIAAVVVATSQPEGERSR